MSKVLRLQFDRPFPVSVRVSERLRYYMLCVFLRAEEAGVEGGGEGGGEVVDDGDEVTDDAVGVFALNLHDAAALVLEAAADNHHFFAGIEGGDHVPDLTCAVDVAISAILCGGIVAGNSTPALCTAVSGDGGKLANGSLEGFELRL